MRKGEWKLYAKARENVRPKGIAEMTKEDKKFFLVNLKEDPGEKQNRAKEFPGLIESLVQIASEKQAGL